MSLTVAAISGVVMAAAKYLLVSKGVELMAEEATKKMGEKGGEAIIEVGKRAFMGLKEALSSRGEAAKKASRALEDVADDPKDEDYQRKLAAELEKMATGDAELRGLLERLSAEVERAGGGAGGQGSVNVSGHGQIYGPTAGTNTGTMEGTYTFGQGNEKK